MIGVVRDLRLALRRLRREPGFTVAAVVTLALGIGVNAALYTATTEVLRPRLGVDAPEDLVILRPRLQPPAGAAQEHGVFSYPMYEAARGAVSRPEQFAAFTPNPREFNLAPTAGAAGKVPTEIVSAGYFDVLGVGPARGRLFSAAEDRLPAEASVILLGDALWRRVFAADPGVIGRVVELEKQHFTVVGVLPPGFRGVSRRAEAWVPMASAPALTFARRLTGRFSFWLAVVGRAVGEPARLEADLRAAALAVESAMPLGEAFGDVRLSFRPQPLVEAARDPLAARAVLLVFGATAGLLLVAGLNAGGLFLVRAVARAREAAVRSALGASWADGLRRTLAESALVGAGGALLGALLTPLPFALVRGFQPDLAGAISVGYVAAAAGAAALVCALLGLAGERLARVTVVRASGAGGDRHGSRLRSVVAAAQLGLVLVVAFGAGQFVRGLYRLYDRPLGFDPTGVTSLRVDAPRAAYPEERVPAFFETTAQRLGELPGVAVAAIANCLPLTGVCDRPQMRIAGREPAPGAPGHDVWMNPVGPGYFEAMGIPILRGRGIEARDRVGAPRVALVDREAARLYWPDADPLGARIQLSVGDDWAEVVGVVESAAGAALDEAAEPGVYIAFAQFPYNSNYIVLRSHRDGVDLAASAERVVHELDPGLAVWDVATMGERLRRAGARPRFGAVLLAAFGGLGTVLAALGVHSVATFAVTRRRREFGVRLALGARRLEVVRHVLTANLRIAALAVAGGSVLAWFVGRWMSSRLSDVAPGGGPWIAAAALWITFVAVVAGALPARRAAGLDPATVLREE